MGGKEPGPATGPAPSPRQLLRIGGLSRAELREALRAHGVQLNVAAEALFEDPRFTTLDQPTTLELVTVSVGALGFGEGGTYAQLVQRALELGFIECPLELGPHLRLQSLDQPDAASGTIQTSGRAPTGSVTVASPPLEDADATPKGFYLRCDGGVLWLRGYWSGPDHVWSAEDVFVLQAPVRADPPDTRSGR